MSALVSAEPEKPQRSSIETDSCAPAHLKLAPSPTRSLLPSQFCLLCRFSQKLHSTSWFAHLCLARRSLGEGGSLASPRLRSLAASLTVPRLRDRSSRSLHCISLTPARLDRYPRGFTGHVAHPGRSIQIESRTSRSACLVCSRN
jgi:hypothetical protein